MFVFVNLCLHINVVYLQIFFVEFLPQPLQKYSVLHPVRNDDKNWFKINSLSNYNFMTSHIDVCEERVSIDKLEDFEWLYK